MSKDSAYQNDQQSKPALLLLAPFLGEITRGAETFVIEWANTMADRYDITIFSYEQEKSSPKSIQNVNASHLQQVSVPKSAIPGVVKTYKNISQKIVGFVSKPASLPLKPFQFLAKVILRILDRTVYFSASALEQYFFSKYVFDHITKQYAIIFPNNGIWGLHFAQEYAKNNTTAVIYTGHGGIGLEEKAIIQRHPDIYIATTPTTYAWAKELSAKTAYIPIGISLDRFETSFEAKDSDKNIQRPVVLCVAALTPFKRQKLLIDAMSKTNGTLILIGDGELRAEINTYCEQILPGRYISIPKVPYEEMPYYFQLCDVFSLPSENEPFGIVYLEAMAANKPVIAPDDDSRRAILGDAGIFCDVTNAEIYAKSIETAIATHWQNKPREQVEKYYSWKTIGDQYHQIIWRLVQSKYE
ncbi:MAG: glycosyltransferase family 4 protein [Candidatus Dojkabacteria bacterium]|nr:MAG: glycosyltransferase family 4 protein [Candidatus Dojkabacteria bacterium]